MRVRRDNSEEPVAAFDDEGGIWHDDLDPGLRIVSEGDAAIENEPVAGITVEVQVHPDLAGAAERDKEQRARIVARRTNDRLGAEIVHRLLFRR